MKTTRFLLAALVASPLVAGAPVWAAPATMAPPASPVPAALPVVDPRATALFAQALKAYTNLDTLSQTFVFSDSLDGTVTPAQSGSGALMLQRPGKARLALKVGDKERLYVANGTKLIVQTGPSSYQSREIEDDAIPQLASAIPSAASVPLSMLLGGDNPLAPNSGIKWQSATLLPTPGLDAVSMSAQFNPAAPPVVFRVYLDPKTHLIVRTDAEINTPAKPAVGDQPAVAAKKSINTTTFTTDATKVAPSTFDFVTPAGATLVEAPKPAPSYDPKLVVGATPFALSDKTLDGKPFSLANYKGKVVLLDFWATWCGPCVGELPNVLTNYGKYHDQGFDIVGVSLDEDETKLRTFIKDRNMPWTQLYDGKGWENADAATYGVHAIPFTLLLGKDGKIAAVNPRGPALEPAIKKAMAG